MTAPEPTPAIRQAGEALHTAWTILPRGIYGKGASEALAAAALAAGVVAEEIAKDLAGHVDFAIHDGRVVCHDCGTDLGPDDGTVPGWELHDLHVAQIIRTRILGEAS